MLDSFCYIIKEFIPSFLFYFVLCYLVYSPDVLLFPFQPPRVPTYAAGGGRQDAMLAARLQMKADETNRAMFTAEQAMYVRT